MTSPRQTSESSFDEKKSLHWQELLSAIPVFERVSWLAFVDRCSSSPESRQMLSKIQHVREQLQLACEQLDRFSLNIKTESERIAKSVEEVAELILEERGISLQDHQAALQAMPTILQDKTRNMKGIFREARRQFDPGTDLPEGLSIYGAAVEIQRRLRSGESFYVTKDHERYLRIMWPAMQRATKVKSQIELLLLGTAGRLPFRKTSARVSSAKKPSRRSKPKPKKRKAKGKRR